MLQLMNRVGAL